MNRLLILTIFFSLLCYGPASAQETKTGEWGLIQDLGTSSAFTALIKAHSAQGLIGPDGSIGRNKRGFVDAAEQRGGAWFMMAGIIGNSPDDISLSIKTMEYGFSRQNPAGYFENTLGASPIQGLEADAFFLQAFGRIASVVRESPYEQSFEARLDQLMPRLTSAMGFLAQQAGELYRQDQNAANRLWFDAIAFELNGRLLNDPHLVELGHKFMHEALKEQNPDGSFREHGGTDTSYQAVSMLNIAVLLSEETDPLIAGKLKASLQSAARWEDDRIGNDGRIDVSGNTRTGLGQETYFGKPKNVNYEEAAQALFYTSHFTDLADLRTKAETMTTTLLQEHGLR